MANATYQSPLINTAGKAAIAVFEIKTLLEHILAAAGGYPAVTGIVSFDFNITTPNVFTVVLTAQLPADQLARYQLTQTG